MSYDAFISYSHAADGKLAPALERGLRRFAKPWNRRRAVHVFRDDSNLGVHPDLWEGIVEALGSSRFFVLLASPEGARSRWVGQEITFWRDNRDPELDRLLMVLTDGELEWMDGDGGGRLAGDAVPPALQEAFTSEPLYLDLRWARTDTDLSLGNPKFLDSVARLSSRIREIPLDELIGEDLKQHKRTKRWVRGTIAVLATLVLAASGAAWFAFEQRSEARTQQRIAEQNAEAERVQRAIADEKTEEARLSAEAEAAQRKIAEEQTRLSVAQRLAVQGELLVETAGPAEAATGSLLVIESLRRNQATLQGQLAWGSVLDRYPPLVARHALPTVQESFAGLTASIDPDGDRLALGTAENGLLVVDPRSGETLFSAPEVSGVAGLSLRATAPVMAVAEGATLRLLDFDRGEELSRIDLGSPVRGLAFSPDGATLGVGTLGRELHLLQVSGAGAIEPDQVLENPAGDVMLPALNPRGRLVMANSWHSQIEENVVLFWDLATGARVGPYAQGDTRALAFSPSGLLAATGGWDDFVDLFAIDVPDDEDTEPMRLPAQCRQVPSDCERVLRTQPIGRIRQQRFDAGGDVLAVAIDPSDEILAAATPGAVRLWDLAGGIERPPLDHEKVGLIAWVDEGRLLATVSATEVRLWNAAYGRQLAGRVRAQGGALEEARASFARYQNEICRRLGRDLSPAEWRRYLGREDPAGASCAEPPRSPG